MNVIKRNGSEVKFNKKKIIDAVTKAMKNCNIKDEDFVLQIADSIEGRNQKVITVEDIQDLIENKLMASKYKNVAQQYIRYRYERERIRHSNTTDDAILSLIEQDNELIKQENSNKNPTIISTQRDYMAGEVSKDLTNRIFLPQDIVEAHKKGLIHFHDADYFAQHCHNCFVRGTKFITVDGTKSFYDFQDNDVIEVFDKFGNIQKATVHYFGIQPVYEYTLRNGKTNIQKIQATEDHKWFLHNDKITTKLKIGDKLLKAPKMFQFDLDYSKLTMEEKIMWCKGFGLGDGTVEYQGKNQKSNRTRIRLCGTKDLQYLNRFKEIGCTISSQNFENGDKIVIIHNYHKEIPNFNTIKELLCFFNGLYCADGKVSIAKGCNKRVYRIQSSNAEVIDFIRKYAECIGLYITSENDLTGEKTNFTDSRPYTILFSFNPNFSYHYKVIDKQYIGEEPVWCLTVENTHSFILSGGIPTGNCDLVNLEDMLQNGTVINGTLVEKPHSFSTACNIATQIMAQVASSQYGGQSISLTHLAPFVNISREKIKIEIEEEWKGIPETIEIKNKKEKIVENRVRKEIKKGVQIMQYQINTLMTTNG